MPKSGRAIVLSRRLIRYSPPAQAAKSLQTAKSERLFAPPRPKLHALPLRADKVSKVLWQAESKLTFGRLVLPVADRHEACCRWLFKLQGGTCQVEPCRKCRAGPRRLSLSRPLRLVVIGRSSGSLFSFPRCAILLPTVWDGLSAWGWSSESFAILRIFAHFQMVGLPMPHFRRGSEGAEPRPTVEANTTTAPKPRVCVGFPSPTAIPSPPRWIARARGAKRSRGDRPPSTKAPD